LELIPVWLLKALEGIFDPPFELPPEPVPDEEFVELQATRVVASSATAPTATIRLFHDAGPTAPP
jgi:hypothetical protein